MKNINNINKFKKIKLVKKGLGISIVSMTILLSGCGTNSNYYMVTDNNKTYICLKEGISKNYDDYDYVSINGKKIGSVCSKMRSFDYSCHHLSTNFLNELQIQSLNQVFEELNLDESILNNIDELKDFEQMEQLDNIRINYYYNTKYDLVKNFIYTEDSKLELFDTPTKVIIGYDISADRIAQKNRFIYSIEDMDVVCFNKNDEVKGINIGLYLTDDQHSKGYITYEEAIEMVNKYNKNHYHRQLVKSK